VQCEKFEARLNSLLDQRLPAEKDGELGAHASSCSSCRDLLSGHEQLLDALELLESPALPTGFAQAVVQKVSQPEFKRPGSKRPAIAIWVAAAAAVLLLGIGIAQWNRGPVALPGPELNNPAPTPESDSAQSPVRWPLQTYSAIWGELSAEPIEQKVDEIAVELRPIAVSISAALEALKQSLPVVRDRSSAGPPQALVTPTDARELT
jgi:anti-sigma factor RsiW